MKLKNLYELFNRKYEQEVKPYIERNIPRNRFSEPVYYILDNFQLRRFRAAFPLIFAEEFGTPKNKVLPIASASELMFSIALVHDDIIDKDDKRGNIPASHQKFGIELCIASCSYMHAQVAKILRKLREEPISPSILEKIDRLFIESCKRLYRSFMTEKLETNNFNLLMEDILKIYKDKTIQGTTSLFASALICTEDEEIGRIIRDYSYNLGIAGQIKNDIYDATSYLKNRGYSDLENGYITYVIRKLLDSVPKNRRANLIGQLLSKEHEKIIDALKKENVIEECLKDCNKYVESAILRIKGKFPKRLEDVLITWAEGNRKFSRQI